MKVDLRVGLSTAAQRTQAKVRLEAAFGALNVKFVLY